VAILNRVTVDHQRIRDLDAWYLQVPAIAAFAAGGIELNPRVTVIIGENGSGKSTFVEAVAEAWRSQLFSASPHWGPGSSGEDADLSWALRLDADSPVSHGGCFLRAEAMHGMFDYADTDASVMRAFGGKLNTRSHGESFLGYLKSRLFEHGLFLLDEPEAALSFASCLQLLVLLGNIADSGSQVILATHSPVLAAFPGATLLEFSDDGIAEPAWDDLDLVSHWRSFMSAPQSYLRHLFD
jgi:predicted ATPase